MADFFDAPTVAELSEKISLGQRAHSLAPAIVLRRGRAGRPVFFIHPVSGLSWCYSKLLRHLDTDRPLYGLQSGGWADGGRTPQPLDAMAAEYAALIRRIQPTGPYALAGWSMGGVLAHEIAVQLQAAGQPVELLALLDSFPPAANQTPDDTDTDTDAEFRAVMSTQLLPTEQTSQADNTAELDQRVAFAVFRHNRSAAAAFRPGRFAGDILLVRAAAAPHERDEAAPHEAEDAWRPHVTGHIRQKYLGCDHYRMLDPGPAATIGEILSAELRD